jgi:hypothetical protein
LDSDPRRGVPRQYCHEQSTRSRGVFRRKFFYLFTCEYCFSHYVAAAALLLTRFKLLFDDWRGYLLAFFALVWVANQYMSIGCGSTSSTSKWKIKADEQVVEERKAA